MKKIAVLCLLLVISRTGDARVVAKMSDAAAKAKAISMWGPHAAVSKFWVAGAVNDWAYQVGCYDPANGFHVTGQGLSSWEAAYTNVDASKNGQFTITAIATDSLGRKGMSPKVSIYACDAGISSPNFAAN